MASTMSRRTFVAAIPLLLAACQSQQSSTVQAGLTPLADGTPDYATAYAARTDGGFSIPAIQYQKFDPKYLRQVVFYPSKYPSGTIVVDPGSKYLYLIQPGGRAIRYGIGVGRAGFAWNGEAEIRFKREWPKWFPPEEMIERDPKLEKYRDGQDGGPSNPIGARGLYLWQGNKDTLYRIHGTGEYWTIGSAVSSGCVRLINQDVIDLYSRVADGSQIVVL